MNPMYVAKVEVSGGRGGHARSDDGVLDIALTPPKAMGGPGTGTNPEQLFAAGYAACFESALRFQAGQHKTPVTKCVIDAEVGLGPREGGGFELAVTLTFKALEGPSRAQAEELIDLVHNKICPYSNAIRSNVPVTIVLPDSLL